MGTGSEQKEAFDDVVGSINQSDLEELQEFYKYLLGETKDKLEEVSQKDASISNVRVKIKSTSEIRFELDGKLVQIQIDYNTGIVGDNTYIIRAPDAIRMAEFLSKKTNLKFTDFTLGVLSDIFLSLVEEENKEVAEKTGYGIGVSTPKIDVLENASEINFADENEMVVIQFSINSVETAPITVNQIISIHLAKEMLSHFVVKFMHDRDAERVVGDIKGDILSSVMIRPIMYQELDRVKILESSTKNIALLLDISMQLTVELGRSWMQIKDILTLGEGSIIELDKLAGEPVDLLVNKKLVAKGEVVVIDETFGVRITEIVIPREHLESLLPE